MELKALADRFSASGPEQVQELIRRAREQQLGRVAMLEWLEYAMPVLRSGGAPGIDPFSGPSWISELNERSSADPFAGPAAGAAFGPDDSQPLVASTFNASVSNNEVLSLATSLHRAGKKPEAIRTLSNLAIPGQHDHALLRLLAWVLQEWGEPVLALEVLEQAERRFGSSDTTARDLALAALTAGRKDEAQQYFLRTQSHVARREAAALSGNMSAALRIVVECADGRADADLEIEGPDYELCSWRNPLPAFGGALSFDGQGMQPEDFVLPARPSHPLKVRVRLHSERPAPVRVMIVEQWGRPEAKVRVILIPQCRPGRNVVAEVL